MDESLANVKAVTRQTGPAPRPDWRLPPGVSRGLWEYTQADHIARRYDESLRDDTLCEFDEQVVARVCCGTGTLADLGCGTGRIALAAARRGQRVVAVDLSAAMLRQLAEKTQHEQISLDLVQANLVELGCIRDASFDHAVCLYSTLGMIHGRDNRRQFLEHVRRILRPQGKFVVHVHNLWTNLFDPGGRWWLVRHLPAVALGRGGELGDKSTTFQGVPNLFLHVFTRKQFLRELRQAGWRIEETIPLCTARRHRLRSAWWLGRVRANGWIAVCRP
ncbi:MAG: class I SAM-dependent methyltransferase [Planctomycetia bacterium]|nr:class I SAM-dependent methyltransferase [Planctomycetia bacterium]